ncbi:expressed unknown protein [Seminavis robusta]|uniref:Transmembrane protein n=1 Tax=Seminavis robusta TaxID=568900 RepID=A0A9N8EBD1_9STRA|nr:expressed unknown protein [Seminavis robusta]|eukprot:Sro898_g217620.1 n/a (428) ;mRNA; r:26142-27425
MSTMSSAFCGCDEGVELVDDEEHVGFVSDNNSIVLGTASTRSTLNLVPSTVTGHRQSNASSSWFRKQENGQDENTEVAESMATGPRPLKSWFGKRDDQSASLRSASLEEEEEPNEGEALVPPNSNELQGNQGEITRIVSTIVVENQSAVTPVQAGKEVDEEEYEEEIRRRNQTPTILRLLVDPMNKWAQSRTCLSFIFVAILALNVLAITLAITGLVDSTKTAKTDYGVVAATDYNSATSVPVAFQEDSSTLDAAVTSPQEEETVENNQEQEDAETTNEGNRNPENGTSVVEEQPVEMCRDDDILTRTEQNCHDMYLNDYRICRSFEGCGCLPTGNLIGDMFPNGPPTDCDTGMEPICNAFREKWNCCNEDCRSLTLGYVECLGNAALACAQTGFQCSLQCTSSAFSPTSASVVASTVVAFLISFLL